MRTCFQTRGAGLKWPALPPVNCNHLRPVTLFPHRNSNHRHIIAFAVSAGFALALQAVKSEPVAVASSNTCETGKATRWIPARCFRVDIRLQWRSPKWKTKSSA
jgi:hypothetical protein